MTAFLEGTHTLPCEDTICVVFIDNIKDSVIVQELWQPEGGHQCWPHQV